MPRSLVRSSNIDEISVTVRGRTFEELKAKALDEAAAYFGVDRDVAQLVTVGSMGKPAITDTDGRVVLYKASIRVRWVTDEGVSEFPAGPEVDDEAEDDD